MGHYKSNLRDIEFNLFEYLGVGEHYGTAPFDAFDQDTAMDALREVDRPEDRPQDERVPRVGEEEPRRAV